MVIYWIPSPAISIFCVKEINEQPRAVRDTTLGRVSLDTGKVFLPDMKISEAEFKAATGITIAACGTRLVEQVIYIPAAHELLLPILEVVPLQLLAYHIAVRRGCDVDQPRNLAKSCNSGII
jgi:glucosamine 6-phosphate synthetase-like amidotransferase/phosphosugar isomerase protein